MMSILSPVLNVSVLLSAVYKKIEFLPEIHVEQVSYWINIDLINWPLTFHCRPLI
jgi:hypothetical protein